MGGSASIARTVVNTAHTGDRGSRRSYRLAPNTVVAEVVNLLNGPPRANMRRRVLYCNCADSHLLDRIPKLGWWGWVHRD